MRKGSTAAHVAADGPETLEQRATAVEKFCVSIDMTARRCGYKNEQAVFPPCRCWRWIRMWSGDPGAMP